MIKRTQSITLTVENICKIKQTIKYRILKLQFVLFLVRKALLAYLEENIPGFNKSQLTEEY